MKKALLFAAAILMMVPSFAQKMSKEEKAALAKAQYEGAVQVINEKNWVIIPDTYDTEDGIENNTRNDNFLSCEKGMMFSQKLHSLQLVFPLLLHIRGHRTDRAHATD